MARPQILEKIAREMQQLPLRSERQVVYLLVEIRKFVDQCNDQERATFPNLKFFCNWVLHSKLDQKSSQKKIIELSSVFDMYDIHSQRFVLSKFHNEMIMLLPLRESLRNFCSTFGISTVISDDQLEWCRFVYYYSGVVSDVPLIRTGDVPETEVKEVRVSRMPSQSDSWPDYIRWDLKLGDDDPRWAATRICSMTPFIVE